MPVAARREVLEETGIETEFVSLIAVRHMQPKVGGYRGTFGCSDFYFVAHLKPVEGHSTGIRMCTRELSDARWMPVSNTVTINDCHQKTYKEKLTPYVVGGIRGSSSRPLHEPNTGQAVHVRN